MTLIPSQESIDRLRMIMEEKEPWMTLEEFLKSRFEGLCFVRVENSTLLANFYDDYGFEDILGLKYRYDHITHVMPIHKPEPPR